MLEKPKRMHALYTIAWYDFSWTEIPVKPKMYNAHELMMELERFNLMQQRIANDGFLIITEAPHPVHLAIEVHYVER